MNQPQLIDSQSKWDQTASGLTGAVELAIDTEANSMYAYRGRVCLIQLATETDIYLVDPLAVEDLSALGPTLASNANVKVLHGSDYDLRSLHREYGFAISGLFDTEIAARFLGMVRPNLAAVLEHFLNVEIPKSRRMQRSNWGLRPLSSEAISYAAADVHYLIPLARRLKELLSEAGRLAWVQEEFGRLEASARSAPDTPSPDFMRVKGSDRLTPQQLGILKELFDLREAEAERIDLPPYRIMGNEVLIYLAQNPLSPLEQAPGLAPQAVRRLGGRIRASIQRGMQGPGIQRPPRPRRIPPTREEQTRLQQLKQWRNDRGASLGLDPSLLWPASSLERLARNPDQGSRELAGNNATEVREWQRKEFAQELKEILAGML